MSKIPVMEIFGPTIQGEGMVVGQKTMFVRTAGCDYSCSWCDSAFTWDGSAKNEIIQMTPEEIWEQLQDTAKENFSHVTISGGNPALLKNLGAFVELLKEREVKIALETQGSKWQNWFADITDLTISPKPPSSNMITNFEILDDIIDRLTSMNHANMSLKIVIFDEKDLEYARGVHKRYPHVEMILQVGNEDATSVDKTDLITKLLAKYEWLIDVVMADSNFNSVRVLPQLHTLIWGNKRGV